MIKKSIIFVTALLCNIAAIAQNTSLNGIVTDKEDKTPIESAAVRIITAADSTQISATLTNEKGSFSFNNLKPGNYVVQINYVGYSAYSNAVELKRNEPLTLRITISKSSKELDEVNVTAQQIRVQQKNDTTEYNAAAFKTNPDATAEDLVKKMPGITQENGVIKAQGEEIKRVTVDGKNFFGDDASLALKNLPAETVDRIQVFDALGDQSAFSSFDDGNAQKEMNIITKKGMNNGLFGKIYGGYGYLNDSRYNTGANVNWFKGKRRLSLLAMSNNVNEQNFSMQDIIGVTGGSGGGRGMRGMGGMSGGSNMRWMGNSAAGNFLVGTQNGIATTHSAGINYTDVTGKKKNVRLSGSYFFNYVNTIAEKLTTRQFFNAGDSSVVYTERNNSETGNTNHRVNLKVEYMIDSMNALIVTPRFSYQGNIQDNQTNGQNAVLTELLGTTGNQLQSQNSGYNFSNDLLYTRRFKKQWRTLSVNFNTVVNNRNAESNLNSLNTSFVNFDSVALNQESTSLTQSYTLGGNLSYTEPVGENGIILLTYNPSYNRNSNNKRTFNADTLTGAYTVPDTLLTNEFDNDYLTHKLGSNYKYRGEKFVVTIGGTLQYALLRGQQLFPQETRVNRTFIDLLPTATFTYKFSNTNSLRVHYRTSTNAPGIQQLQNVVDNSNPLLLTTGNPDLKQTFNHFAMLRYSYTNTQKAQSFFLFASFNHQANFIGNATIIATNDTVVNGIKLNAGSQLNLPVNLPGFFGSNMFSTFSLPINKLKSNLSINTGYNYSRNPSLINLQKSFSNNHSFTAGINLSSNISEKVDFTINYTGTYVLVKNTLQRSSDNNYFTHNASLRFNWLFWKGFVFNTSVTNTLYAGAVQSLNTNFVLWNAALGYKFLKDKSLELRFSVNDILNQNTGVSRSVTETFLEDIRYNVLQRYLMLTLTYNLRLYDKNK